MSRRPINVKHAFHLSFWRVLIVGALVAATSATTASPVVTAKAPVASAVATPRLTPIALFDSTTSTSELPTTTTTVVPPWSVGNSGPFAVAPNQPLPTPADCAAKVAKAPEVRAMNSAANHTSGSAAPATFRNWGTNAKAVSYAKRVDGQFTGTTDEIIQWAACKWGFDPEPVRAQVMVESSWRQIAYGGFVPDTGSCSDTKLRRAITASTTTTVPEPVGATTTTTTTAMPSMVETTTTLPVTDEVATTTTTTTRPAPQFECPTAYGLMQLRSDYQPGSYPMSARSTAFNLDYSLAMKRACYDGVGWHGSKTTGDAWGCVGVHYSGQWLDAAAKAYIAKVQAAESTKAWLRL